ncbi:OmpA family protein [Hymenobacter sp. 5317J-9]|uniref:OmpA family protein n=1 Tax=Hymenobacter sp. 5317J-9 TaxID=2932250 RepID=UPI001FD64253|nr:OmpA family protein [Hymenobacter sp. 5317J-9]UOQ96443.1 OmpA family protein [Hymenobacter sp. 5317J-9]
MKNTVSETVSFRFSRETIARLGTRLGEAAPDVDYALRDSVTLVLDKLSEKVGRGLTPEGLLTLVQEADAAQVLQHFAGQDPVGRHELGLNLLLDLLDGSYRATVTRIAAAAAIEPATSDALLQLAATAVLGVLGHAAAEKAFSPNEFAEWLHAEKANLAAAMLPAPVAVATLPLTGELGLHLSAEPPARLGPTRAAWAASAAPGGGRLPAYWQWGALLLLAVCLGYFFGRNTTSRDQPAAHSLAATSPAPAPATPARTAAFTPPETPPAAAPELVPEPAPTPALPAARPAPPAASRPVAAVAGRAPASKTARPATPRPAVIGNEPNGRYDQDRDTYIYDTGKPIMLVLADGSRQKVGANSTENRLYTFLSSPAFQVDSVNRTKGWINFDRINFESGKAQLTLESARQLGNIASILNTFPKSLVKIGGYTDSTGDAEANYQLSEDRARAAMHALTSLGVSPGRVQAKGYGPKYFVRPNTTLTNRAMNRRVSIRVLRK